MPEFQKIATLENEIEARLLQSILQERRIPHRLQSYHDTAYNGLYQAQKGWGCVQAPAEFGSLIQEILGDLRHTAENAPSSEGG